MLAVNYSTIRSKLKLYCDQATDCGEIIVITRKEEKNVVLISLEKYNELERLARLAEHLVHKEKEMEEHHVRILNDIR